MRQEIEKMSDEEFLRKFDSGERFTEDEIADIVIRGVGKLAYNHEGQDNRWTREVRKVYQIGDRYFAIDYDRALTEIQENEYWYQPQEVEKYTYEKAMTIVEWKEKKK